MHRPAGHSSVERGLTVDVPMLKDDELIGAFSIYRQEVRPFTEQQIDLVRTLPIRPRSPSKTHGCSTSCANRSSSRLPPPMCSSSSAAPRSICRRCFDTLVESAARICQADIGHIALPTEGGSFRTRASYGFSPELKAEHAHLEFKPGRGSVTGRALLERATVHIIDAQTDPEYKLPNILELSGHHSMIGTPLLREGSPIGVFGLARLAVRPFTEKQIELLTTFADQAVIAIENARLFDEVQARTRDLTKSLEQQTATSQVLQVISSSPGELEPVFQAMLENATRICEANFGSLVLFERQYVPAGCPIQCAGSFVEGLTQNPFFRSRRRPLSVAWRRSNDVIHLIDILAEYPDEPMAKLGGARTIADRTRCSRKATLIGAINIFRQEVRPFTDKQIELVTELRRPGCYRHREHAAAQRAARIAAAADRHRRRAQGHQPLDFRSADRAGYARRIRRPDCARPTMRPLLARKAACSTVGSCGLPASPTNSWITSRTFRSAGRATVHGRALLEGRTVHIPDVLADPEYTFADAQRLGGFRTVLGVPMLREGSPSAFWA